jgi:hypothetical protein
MSWDSSPPDPQGVPEARHARWLEEAFYLLWRQGVDTVTWFQIRDQAPEPSYPETNQSGVFFRDGRPKLAATAFRFAFVAVRSGGRVRFWGHTAAPGLVRIEGRTARGWAVIASVRPKGGVFQEERATRYARFRAVQDRLVSLVWPR